jgi:uncharacterized protein (DUF488 family)
MLFTFGYEGLDIGPFIGRLHKAGVKVVLDVRELPLSRKRGFSKRAFSEALNSAGLEYRHLAALGCPKAIRNRYKLDGDWDRYCRDFLAYLSSQTDAIAEVVLISEKVDACLICFEADHRFCHRSLVANAAASVSGREVQHLALKAIHPDALLPAAA